jgi:serine phosphatase RsbU (regulator of sigma subunit)/HAMP domain-containing protein
MNTPKKRIKFSLKYRITFSIVLLIVVIMGTVTYVFTIRELDLRVEQVKLQMNRLANNIATIRAVETEDWVVYQNYIDNQLKLNPDIVYITIFDEQMNLKAHVLNAEWLDLGGERTLTHVEETNIVMQLDRRQIARESQKDFESISVSILSGERNLGVVKVGFSLVDLNDAKQRNLRRNFGLAVLFIVCAMGISFLMSQQIVKPIGKLTDAMSQISRGNLDQEVHIRSSDEIGEMAETFNFMAKGLQEKAQIEKLGSDLNYVMELDKIAKLVNERITLALEAENGYLFLRDKEDKLKFILASAYPDQQKKRMFFHCGETDCKNLIRDSQPQPLIHFCHYPEMQKEIQKLMGITDRELLIPMIIKDEVLGLFILGPKKTGSRYGRQERQFLMTLVRQGGFAIENANLLDDLTEQERLKHEFDIARRVQQNLLPKFNPGFPGLDIDGICIPATEIGGDYYDFFVLDDHTLGVAIADVTGKGASAAFYMAVVKGMMLSLTAIHTSPRQLLIDLNQRLFGSMDRKVFITMIYAVVDVSKRVIRFSRAGHNALVMHQSDPADTVCMIPEGIGLGLEGGKLFEKSLTEQTIPYRPGDIFLFYTDGVSEAMNLKRQEFGEERLIRCLNEIKNESAVEITKKILKSIHGFIQKATQNDDITIVTLKAV